MSLFGGIESDEPETRAGLFKRLRTPKASFVEPATSVEPRFKSAARPVKPGVSFLGRSLSDDVEDVESTPIEPVPIGSQDVAIDGARAHSQRPRNVVADPVAEQTAAINSISRVIDASLGKEEESVVLPEVALGSARQQSVDVNEPSAAVASRERSAAPVPPLPCEPPESLTDDDAAFNERADALFAQPGRPSLVSAEALPDYKRILTTSNDDAALRIPSAARKEFIALELQPGVAISVATAKFCERAQYATFIKDLANADVFVREELIATEEVIAGIYAGKAVAVSKGRMREASRAIGNFRDIIEAAHHYGASDVHFEPREFESDVEIRFRVNGDLYTYERLPKTIVRRALFASYSDLVQKNTNSGNSFQPTAPQSAMIPLVVSTDTVNLRWQSSPLVGGYDVALRLLDGNFKNYKVLLPKDMGFERSQLDLIDTLNYVSGGITALTGETGSGKTTTLRALSYQLPERDLKKQFAVNEPSEYPMPWLSDYSIIRRPDETDDEANRKYAEVIRTLMRQDPDDLTIGEVRDKVVMGLVAELALTGHPVRFSLHAGDIIAAIMRMAGGRLQLPIDELSSDGFINAVGNQKLIPTLCEHCKIPAEEVMPQADLEILRRKFGLDTSKMACRNMDGCVHCRLVGLTTRSGKVAGGTKRQSVVAELYRPTPEFLDHVSRKDWAGARQVWRGSRNTGFDDADMTGKTLYEHALFKVSRGLIDPQFVHRSMQGFAQYRVMPGVDGLMP